MRGKTAEIPRECCAQHCHRVATKAYKLSDFWVSFCDEHEGKELSINKAIDACFAGKLEAARKPEKP